MNNQDKRGQPWIADDEAQLLAMLRSGATLSAIAKQLGRTEGAVLSRMEQMAYQHEKFVKTKQILLSF